jgi:N-acetylmuramoyl-L-alanine amidase
MNQGSAERRGWGLFIAVAVPFVLISLLAAPALAGSDRVLVNNIRYFSASEHARIVLDLSSPVEFSKNRLKGPDRIFIDLKDCVLSGRAGDALNSAIEDEGLLKKIRAALYRPDVLRVVFDLRQIKEYKIFTLENPFRVVVDVFGEEKLPVFKPDIKRIVIDPGHGGRDPGAVGKGGVKEKDVVLDVARRIKEILGNKEGYEVYITRSKDIFLNLEARTLVAKKNKADMFISIHANANRDRRIKGIETYLLNWTNDKSAKRVAARENRIYVRRTKKSRSELGAILAGLKLQNKRDESLVLAHYVQDSIVSSLSRKYRGIVDLGVKQALFHVLIGAEMPSVLVEVSFVTNSLEAKRLKSKDYRKRLAEGIASGVQTYFKQSKPVQKIAQR